MQLPSAYASAASYWVPPHMVPSAWHGHAPFAAWLMEALRPRTVVELGTHNGFSLFTMAEAARRLGLDSSITAVDSWEGDDHAGFYGPQVMDSVIEIAKASYPDSVRLDRAYFADAAERVEDGSVDLLHIDGRHGYEDVTADFDAYRSKLSPQGVAIFHDCFEFQPGFGVHRFWDEISVEAPSFRFEHSHGLGIVAYGSEVSDSVRRFLTYANEHGDEVRTFYAALGSEIQRIYQDRQDLLDQLHLARVDAIKAHGALAGALSAVQEITSSTSWKMTAPVRAVGGWVRR